MSLAKISLLSLSFLLLSTASVLGQSRKLEKANKKFDQLDFRGAIELYKEVLLEDDQPEAIIRIADCYRLLNDPVSAEVWYEKAIIFYDDPLNFLFYAQALHENGNYDKAKIYYEKFDEFSVDDSRGKRGIIACKTAKKLMSRPPLFLTINLPFNDENNDFGPAFYNEGICFTSDRRKSLGAQKVFDLPGKIYRDLYFTKRRSDSRWAEPKYLPGAANTMLHDGPATFSKDFKEMYFTRNHYNPNALGGVVNRSEEGVVKLKIMSAWYDEDKEEWGKAQEFPYNFQEYSLAHPALSRDGKFLYFASDMPGGYGGTDLYVSRFADGYWMQPVNMGPVINTEGHEKFPFVGPDSSLYFSSNTHAGLGGLDVFKAYYNPITEEYERIWNLGVPLNSPRDDFGFIIDQKEYSGYFSSNRVDSKGGDDIYGFKAKNIFFEVLCLDKETGKPIEDIKIKLTQANEEFVTGLTDDAGRFMWAIPKDKRYTLVASKKNYHEERENFNTMGMQNGKTIYLIIHMENNLDLMLEGLVLESTHRMPINEAVALITNEITGQRDTAYSECDGTFKYKMYPDMEYYVYVDKDGYTFDEKFLNTYGMDDPQIVRERFILDGPFPDYHDCFVFDNIYFDYNKATLRPEAREGLQKLLKILQLSPGLNVELGAHTDSRGSEQYNEVLSQKRAQSVVDYLMEQGIEEVRLTPKGYGEYVLRNECASGVNCSEEQHQRNRRVELKVLGDEGQVLGESEEDLNMKVIGKGGRKEAGSSKSNTGRRKINRLSGSGEWQDVEVITPGGR